MSNSSQCLYVDGQHHCSLPLTLSPTCPGENTLTKNLITFHFPFRITPKIGILAGVEGLWPIMQVWNHSHILGSLSHFLYNCYQVWGSIWCLPPLNRNVNNALCLVITSTHSLLPKCTPLLCKRIHNTFWWCFKQVDLSVGEGTFCTKVKEDDC